MKIYDEQDKELMECDESLGHLEPYRRFVKHHDAIPEVQEVTRERIAFVYPTQGAKAIAAKDFDGDIADAFGVEMATEVVTAFEPAIEAYDEYEDAYKYVLYTQDELNQIRTAKLRAFLIDTDYIPLKIVEGASSAPDYADVLAARKIARQEIAALEGEKNRAKYTEEAAKIIEESKPKKEDKNGKQNKKS